MKKKKKTLGDGFSVSATLLLEMLLRKKTEAAYCAIYKILITFDYQNVKTIT